MLSKKTIELCIEKLESEYKKLFRQVTNSEEWMAMRDKDLYRFENALFELKNELQTIEEENLSE